MEQTPDFTIKSPTYHESFNISNLQKIRVISSGTYGDVYLLQDSSSSKLYALKVFRSDNISAEKIDKEVKLSVQLNSMRDSEIYFVRCYGIVEFNERLEDGSISEGKKGLMFDKADGNLNKFLKTLQSHPSFTILLHLLSSIVDCLLILQQNLQCSHLDLKPANIVYERVPNRTLPRFKLIDYGETLQISSIGTLKKGIEVVGTPHYFSPELNYAFLNGTDTSPINTYKSDVYALGITILETGIGRKIKFPKNEPGEERFNEKFHNPQSEVSGPYDNMIVDLIREMVENYKGECGIEDFGGLIEEMLRFNYNKRPTLMEIALKLRLLMDVRREELVKKVQLYSNQKEDDNNVADLRSEVETLYKEKEELIRENDSLKDQLSILSTREEKMRRKYEKIKIEKVLLLEKLEKLCSEETKCSDLLF